MFYIGIDLGQHQDYSAIAALEREDAPRTHQFSIVRAPLPLTPQLLLRRIERIPLGTPYPRIVQRLHAMAHQPPFARNCALVIDGTGVGAPVVDMLRESGLGCELTAVTITGGEHESRRGPLYVSVPKRDLISGLQLALEKGELRISRRMKESATLSRELLALRTGRDCPEHDDLVLALALACWRARRKVITPGGRLPGI